MKDIKTSVGKRIRALRKEKGLSQEELGALADLHHTYIGAVERGERNCSIDSLSKIAKGLNINIGELFSADDKPRDLSKIKATIITDVDKCPPAALLLISDMLSYLKKLGVLQDLTTKKTIKI